MKAEARWACATFDLLSETIANTLCIEIRMFWNRKDSPDADAYVRRIHQIMLFATALAGKNKPQATKALRDGLGIRIEDVEDSENRTWADSTIDDLTVSFSLDFNNPILVSQIQITGYGVIDGLIICANGLERAEPRKVNFNVDVVEHRTRPTPALARTVGEKLMHHPDFECESFGTMNILRQRNRNR
jgi:hypothetical protein